MLIPIGTNIVHRRQPYVTYWIIALNLLIFALQWATQRSGGTDAEHSLVRYFSLFELEGQLSSSNFHVWSLFTYQFLHGGWMHIFGNMLFLLPFGKVVEDRLGHLWFALFYLGTGALGGLVHILFYSSPVIGASGSVCGVVAAFIVLAPKTKIHILLVFFIIGVYTVPSMLIVAFFVLFDTFSLLASLAGADGRPTAWAVHLTGYVVGFVVAFLGLTLKLIQPTEFDLTQMIRQSNRRRAYKKTIQSPTAFKTDGNPPLSPEEELRSDIVINAADGNIEVSTSKYLQAIIEFPSLRLDTRTLHLIGSYLLQSNRFRDGVKVFERYLSQHPTAKDKGEVALLLAAKYARELNNPQRASELLSTYGQDVLPQHKALASTITEELRL